MALSLEPSRFFLKGKEQNSLFICLKNELFEFH